MIGAHLDTWDLSPGAIDNGVGVATVMDIAQHLVSLPKKPKRTIHFILFAAEEQGLFGSFHNVDLMVENKQIDNIKYMINIDMMANAKGFNSVGHKGTEQFIEMVGKHIASLDSTYPNINEHKKFNPGVDHKPYMLQGIPVILPVQGMDPKMVRPTYHTDRDTMDKVKPEYLENNFRRIGELITILANLDSVPAVKMDDEQTKQWMLKHNFKEALMRTNNWRWEATS
ncbi:M28 family metallopeptidase [Photobacterium sanctipauli]|uniref:M28 family metallopeptidase n=1 Tax=Photobacterium sanctipauli TaxID=1342794 RepID=UPI00055BE048|nr:M28 family metallopeptidase [Photobacterium sanctipauli]